jgi:hypothetical protein
LSKSGFEIELDNELENNIGTVDELGNVILEGSDWVVEKGSNLYQFVEEPLYKIGITEPLNGAKDMETGEPLEMEFQENEIKYIYVFYSHINNQDKTIQFLYNNNMPFLTNDDLVIDKNEHKNYILSDVVYEVDETTGRSWPSFAAKNNLK